MRRALLVMLLVPACTVAGPDTHVERGGEVRVTRTMMGGTETLTAVGTFFTPPGPAEEEWPANDSCVTTTPGPTPSATATPVQYRDAGASIALHGAGTLTMSRFQSGDAIAYLAPPGVDATTVPFGETFALELAGSTAPNGLSAKTIANALEMPAAVSLSIPDFTQGSVALAGTSLAIGWDGTTAGHEVLVTLFVTGTAGGVTTLRCVTGDDGSFVLDASALATLPTGAGLLGITRQTTTVAPLDGTIDVVGVGAVVESGPVLLP